MAGSCRCAGPCSVQGISWGASGLIFVTKGCPEFCLSCTAAVLCAACSAAFHMCSRHPACGRAQARAVLSRCTCRGLHQQQAERTDAHKALDVQPAAAEKLRREVARLTGELERVEKEVQRQKGLR